MDAARREKKEHGTLSFPFQIYPALDGSEADDSDFIPYHWHPELEIITVDCGRVSLTIADRMYEGARGDVFFAASEELHEIRAAGRENQFRSFVFAADFLQFARADETEFALLEPLAEGRLRFATCLRSGEPGQSEVRTLLAQIVRTWQQQAPGCQLAVKAALLGIVAVCAQYGRLEGRDRRLPRRALHRAALAARGRVAFRPVAAVFQHVFPGKLRPHLYAAHQLSAHRAGGASAARDRSSGHGGRLQRRLRQLQLLHQALPQRIRCFALTLPQGITGTQKIEKHPERPDKRRSGCVFGLIPRGSSPDRARRRSVPPSRWNGACGAAV